jgi:hypothetical protein
VSCCYSAEEVAVHEAGHAAFRLLSGLSFKHAKIEFEDVEGDGGGHVAHAPIRCFPVTEEMSFKSFKHLPSRSHYRSYTLGDLARIVEVWPVLPDTIKVGVLAMVKAASQTDR